MVAAYTFYMWNEVSGSFIKFEVWATNIFLKQYKVLSRGGGGQNIVDAKKENKKILRRFYLFLILPVSVLSLALLFYGVVYPLLPEMTAALQGEIFIFWLWFAVPGAVLTAAMPVVLDKVLNARLRFAIEQFKESYYVITIYLFVSLVVATVISISRYTI